MLHPAIPFITEYIYQDITQEKILLAEVEVVTKKAEINNDL